MYTIVHHQQEEEITFEKLISSSPYTLVYFYPKDNTPGCTREAIDFSKFQKDFASKGIQIIGISKDSSESHCIFQDKHQLTIPLISDPKLILHKKFGARGEKNMYGKIVKGVIRSTFILNKKGDILQQRKNVRAKNHAEKVLARTEENI